MRRRGLLELAMLAPLRAAVAAATPKTVEIDRVFPGGVLPQGHSETRRYRVDATILLISLPVFQRAGVGEGSLVFHESRVGGNRRLALEFSAFSDPARAHGLDRFGWIREAIVEHEGRPLHTAVLGIMSESPEQSATEARSALHGDHVKRFIAIDSCSEAGATRTRIAHFPQSDGPLPILARASFDPNCPWRTSSWESSESAPMSFLYCILAALEHASLPAESHYVYNEDRFRMRLERSAAKPLVRYRATIQNLTRALAAFHFQFWLASESGSLLPVRIDFQPRPFLRLTLEALDDRKETA